MTQNTPFREVRQAFPVSFARSAMLV